MESELHFLRLLKCKPKRSDEFDLDIALEIRML